jgi:4'-phosphopantetheinyl transferase EntD
VADLAIRLSAAQRAGDVLAEAALAEGQLVAIGLPGPVDAPPHAALLDALHPVEREVALAHLPRRRRTYVAGRLALRQALSAAGASPSPADLPAIEADDRGAPRVPAGFRGSIAHKDEVAVALAGRDDGARVGVDVEPLRALAAPLGRRILTPEELAALDRRCRDDDDRGRELLRAFAAKEAIYKAIDPFLRRYVGFLEVVLHRRGDAWEVEPRLSAGEPRLRIEVRTLDAGDVALAVATARRG